MSTPDREAVQVRVELPNGAAIARHTHPGEEVIYVLSGEIEYDVAGGAPVMLKPGEVLFVPAGTPHAARNVGEGAASEVSLYIVKPGAPLSTPAP